MPISNQQCRVNYKQPCMVKREDSSNQPGHQLWFSAGPVTWGLKFPADGRVCVECSDKAKSLMPLWYSQQKKKKKNSDVRRHWNKSTYLECHRSRQVLDIQDKNRARGFGEPFTPRWARILTSLTVIIKNYCKNKKKICWWPESDNSSTKVLCVKNVHDSLKNRPDVV